MNVIPVNDRINEIEYVEPNFLSNLRTSDLKLGDVSAKFQDCYYII